MFDLLVSSSFENTTATIKAKSQAGTDYLTEKFGAGAGEVVSVEVKKSALQSVYEDVFQSGLDMR